MRRKVFTMVAVLMVVLFMASCVTNTHIVGNGPDQGYRQKQRQFYLLGGLLPLGSASSNAMAGGDPNYKIVTEYSLMDFVISAITGGILMSRTVTVVK